MKLNFVNAEKVLPAVKLVASDIDITLASADDCDVKVAVKETDAPTVSVKLDNDAATITYGDGVPRFFTRSGDPCFLAKER